MVTKTFLGLIMSSLFSNGTQYIALGQGEESGMNRITSLDDNGTTRNKSISCSLDTSKLEWKTTGSVLFNENKSSGNVAVDGLMFYDGRYILENGENSTNKADGVAMYAIKFNSPVSLGQNHLIKLNAYSSSPKKGIKIKLQEVTKEEE